MADEGAPQPAIKPVPIVDNDGNWGTIAPEEANLAVQQHGFRIPTAQEVSDHALENQYGTGIANSIEAGLEEAGSVATFGASRELENATGLTTPQAQAARAKFNPVSRVVGGALPVIATLGAGAPEAAAEGAAEATGVGLGALNPISAVTHGAESVAKSLVPAVGEGRLGAAATGALRGATSGAIAGGAFGAGNAISEDALGDPDALGEHLLQNIGIGALWGGVPGGILGSLSHPVPEAASEAAEAVKNTESVLGQIGPVGKALAGVSSMVSGAPREEIEYAIANKARALVTPEQFVSQAEDLTKNLQGQFDALSKASRAANSDLRPAETRAALDGVDPAPARDLGLNLLGKIDEAARTMRSEPSLYSQYYPAYLEKALKDSLSKIGDESSAADVFSAIDELKGKIDDNLIHYGANVPPEQQAAEQIAKSIRSELKQSLENQDVFGEAGARQAQFNDAQNSYLKQVGKRGLFRKYFTSQITTKSGKLIDRIDPGKVQTFLRNVGTLTGDDKAAALQSFMDSSKGLVDQIQKTYESLPNSAVDLDSAKEALATNAKKIADTTEQGKFNKIMGRLGGGAHNAQMGEVFAGYEALKNPALGAGIEAFNMARAPALAIRRYAQIARASASVASTVKKGAAAVFNGALPALKPVSDIIPAVSGLIGTDNPGWSEAKAKSEAVRNIAGNVSALSDRLSGATAHLSKQAPKTSVGLMSAGARATAYLNSVVPQSRSQYLLDDPKEVSKADQNKLDRALQLVDQPHAAFHWIKDGTISADDLRGLTQVYPHTYGAMRTEILSHLSDPDRPKMSYSTKMALSKFVGQPLDGSMSPETIQSNQAGLSLARQQTQTPGMQTRKTAVSGMKNFKASKRASTATQESLEE